MLLIAASREMKYILTENHSLKFFSRHNHQTLLSSISSPIGLVQSDPCKFCKGDNTILTINFDIRLRMCSPNALNHIACLSMGIALAISPPFNFALIPLRLQTYYPCF